MILIFFSLPLLYFFIQNKNEINNKVFYLIDSIIIINIIYNTVFLYFFPNYLEVYNFSGDIDYFKSLNLQSTNFVLFTYIFYQLNYIIFIIQLAQKNKFFYYNDLFNLYIIFRKSYFFIFALISLFYFFNKILIYNFSYFYDYQ